MITDSGFGESSVPQNLGMGQNECPDRNIVDIADVAVDIGMFESPVSSRKRFGRCYYFTPSTP
jgi:hypothetical protein